MTNSSAARTNLTFKDVTINSKELLGQGRFRECYEGIYIGGHRNQQDAACKLLKNNNGHNNNTTMSDDPMVCTDKAIQMAELWNEICDKNKKILLSQGSLYKSPHDGLTYLIEPLIRDCTKFNSNTGWISTMDPEWQVRCMEAFSHFTYHQSGGQLLVVDIQGRYRKDKFKKAKCRFELCSDPAICSRDATFGPTDLGEKGIHAFFANHQCNEFCQASWSRPKTLRVASSWFPLTKGTSMICPQVASNKALLQVKNPATFRVGSNGLLEMAEEEEKENKKFATVANSKNSNMTNNNKNKKKSNAPATKTFTNIEIVGEQVVGEFGESGSDWSSAAENGNNSGSDWSDDDEDDSSDDKDRYNNNETKGVYGDDDDDYEVAGDTDNFNNTSNNSYDIYGDDYGSEYGDVTGDTTDDFFIGHGIGSDDEKIVGEQSDGDDSSDFADDDNDEANNKNQDEGENAIIFC